MFNGPLIWKTLKCLHCTLSVKYSKYDSRIGCILLYVLYIIASLKVISATNPSINVFQNFLYFAKYIEKFLLYSKRGTYFCEEINIPFPIWLLIKYGFLYFLVKTNHWKSHETNKLNAQLTFLELFLFQQKNLILNKPE